MGKLKGTAAEGAVSYADLVALGGAHAVRMTGGPTIKVPIGTSATQQPRPADQSRKEKPRLATAGMPGMRHTTR